MLVIRWNLGIGLVHNIPPHQLFIHVIGYFFLLQCDRPVLWIIQNHKWTVFFPNNHNCIFEITIKKHNKYDIYNDLQKLFIADHNFNIKKPFQRFYFNRYKIQYSFQIQCYAHFIILLSCILDYDYVHNFEICLK